MSRQHEWVVNGFIVESVVFKAETSYIVQLLKCEDVLLFTVLYHFK